MIKLQAIGNLGKDAQVNQVNGKNVINFTVAHTEKYRDSSGTQKEKTTWLECAYWTDRIGVVPFLKKGTQVYIEGAPEVRQFTRSDGSAGATLSLRISYLQLVGGRTEQPGQTTGQENSTPISSGVDHSSPVAENDLGDDLPF